MDADQVIRIALTVITPILTAGIGIVALVIGDWRDRRTQAGRRKLALEDASRQVAFAADWWNASKLIANSPDAEQQAATRAQAWLDEASALVVESKPPPVDEKPAITFRRLLLAYPMERRGARILRALFYCCLGIVAFQVSGAMVSAMGRPDTLGIPDYFSGGLIYGDLMAVAAVTVIAMALRFWSLRVEKSQPRRNRGVVGRFAGRCCCIDSTGPPPRSRASSSGSGQLWRSSSSSQPCWALSMNRA